MVAAVLLTACGGGGGGSSSGGGGGSGSGGSMFPDRGGGESSQPPPSVQTARISFDSASGERCCVAVDAALIPNGGLLVLDDLPAGPAVVRVSFFPGDFAPAIEGVTMTCSTNPPSAGTPCDPNQVASPSFESEPQMVDIKPGQQTNVEDLVIDAVPFVLDFAPENAVTVNNPVTFDFTVVDAVTGIDAGSVALDITVQVPDGPVFHPLTKRIPLTLSECTDLGEPKCSPDGALGVVGYRANSDSLRLYTGPIQVNIVATNEGDPPQIIPASIPPTPGFQYDFEVAQ